MRCVVALTGLALILSISSFSQQRSDSQPGPAKKQSPEDAERNKEARESSSRSTLIDLSPPKDDAKNHPFSASAVADAQAQASGDVDEFRPYDPHRAVKSIEVGDYYFKRKNYRAALDRYREALEFKPNDALANFHMAQCLEKLGSTDEAIERYRQYLKILPQGELSEEAQKSMDRLNSLDPANQVSAKENSK